MQPIRYNAPNRSYVFKNFSGVTSSNPLLVLWHRIGPLPLKSWLRLSCNMNNEAWKRTETFLAVCERLEVFLWGMGMQFPCSSGSHSTSVCKSRFINGSCRNSVAMIGTWKKTWVFDSHPPHFFVVTSSKWRLYLFIRKTWEIWRVWTYNMILTALDSEYKVYYKDKRNMLYKFKIETLLRVHIMPIGVICIM